MYQYSYKPNNRVAGGFLGPFILGGITGGLVAPAFYPPRPNNFYPGTPVTNNYYPVPYPYQPPFYR